MRLAKSKNPTVCCQRECQRNFGDYEFASGCAGPIVTALLTCHNSSFASTAKSEREGSPFLSAGAHRGGECAGRCFFFSSFDHAPGTQRAPTSFTSQFLLPFSSPVFVSPIAWQLPGGPVSIPTEDIANEPNLEAAREMLNDRRRRYSVAAGIPFVAPPEIGKAGRENESGRELARGGRGLVREHMCDRFLLGPVTHCLPRR